MTRKALPISIIVLGVVVALLHAHALNNFLYWHLPWLDILMHFLGGLLVALIGLWIARKTGIAKGAKSKWKLLIDILLFVFIVSLLWESFELTFQSLVSEDPYEYAIDTIIDFLMSTIGALFGFYILQMSPVFKETTNI